MKRVSFREKISEAARLQKSRLVLSLDLIGEEPSNLEERASGLIDQLGETLAAVKIGNHLLLPLELSTGIARLNERIHRRGLPVIADVKINDIEATNLVTANYLWRAGFDAMIANPLVGYEGGLKGVIDEGKREGKGIILLAYMSHAGAGEGYGLSVLERGRRVKMYSLFVRRALDWGVDGLVVGATEPRIISVVRGATRDRVLIFSPGVGLQGGDPQLAVNAGADYLIVGRSILNSENPGLAAERFRRLTWVGGA